MARNILSTLLAIITLLAITVQATPIAGSSALNLRVPPTPDPEDCQPPLLLCDKACCSATSTCGPTGLCVPKPGWGVPSASITYTNDPKGRPTVINVHGSNFHLQGSAGIQYVKNGYAYGLWYNHPITPKNFGYSTGIQDCSKTGKASSKTDGYPGEVHITDLVDHGTDGAHLQLLHKVFQVRVTETGICP